MAKRANLGLVVVVLVCFGGLAGEQALGVVPFPFYESFENIDVGDYPDENGWRIMFSGVTASVSDDVAHTGSKSFNLDGTTWGRHDYVSVGPPEWVSDNMTYEVSLYIPVGNAAVARVGFGNPEYGDYTSFRNSFFVGSPGAVNEITFLTYYKNRPPGDPIISVGTYTPGTWVTLRADLYFGSLQADLWLNGELKVIGAPIKPKEWTHPEFGYDVHDRWVIATGDGDMYFDDVALTPVLVPTVLSIEITGPSEIAENFSYQFKAMALCEDGFERDITSLAVWSVEPNTAANIDGNGILTTQDIVKDRSATILASYTEEDVTFDAEKVIDIFAICPTGTALRFDGVDDYVEVSNEEIFDISDKLTLSAWIRPNRFDSRIVSKWKSGNLAYVLCLIPGGNLQFAFSSDCSWDAGGNGPDAWLVNSIQTINTGIWSHCAAVHDGSTIRVYVNGNETIRTSVSATICTAGSESVKIGIDGDGYGPFDGIIDEVSIYERVLSIEEIRANMHRRLASDEPGLVGCWDFDEGGGQIVYDLSGNGNDGQLGSTPSPDVSDPAWVDSDAPIGICNPYLIATLATERAVARKTALLEELLAALAQEWAAYEALEELLESGDYGDLNKGDIVTAKQKIHSATRNEEQAIDALEKSIEKLKDALSALGYEPEER